MKTYIFEFAGVMNIEGFSSEESVAKFREWLRACPGTIFFDNYKCINDDEEEIEE